MKAVVSVVVLLALSQLCWSVDRSKFKTCEQAAFCKRNRANGKDDNEERKQRYKLLATSLKLDQAASQLTGEIKDTRWPLRKPLSLNVQILQNNVVRARITEVQPLHPRWEVRDVLEADALKASPSGLLHNKEEHTVSFTFGDSSENELVVTVDPLPFKLQLRIRGSIAMEANALGLMNFEPYRERNPRPELPPPAAPADATEEKKEADANAAPPAPVQADPKTSAHPYDEENYWEESFSTHQDSKPRGPADVTMDVSFVDTKFIYGIPEHASSLPLKNTNGDNKAYNDPFRLYNLDVFEYELDNPMALYGAIPFIMSVSPTKSVGMLWLNTAETFIDISEDTTATGEHRKISHWISESGIIDLFFFVGPKPTDVFAQYAQLTGKTALPARFAVAYHQCRWNYKSEEDVAAVDAGFDEHDIPVDVLWLDIEHTDGKKYFTWDNTNFPHPEEMQNKLAAKGRKMVTIIDPHIKRDGGYHVHTKAQAEGLYVKNKKSKGGDYEGWCWPGSVSYLDFLQPKVREFWANQFALDKYKGSTQSLYTWNDMNEPSVFNGPEVTMYKDCLHGGDEEIEHRDVHNIYGAYVQSSSALGQIKRDNARPFVLTRSFFAGSQRYGAMWTGDNKAEWSHLVAAAPMLLSLAVSGFSFVGADVGGFFGDPPVELLVRWYQAAAYTPFFRAHAHIDTKRREPWLFGEPHTTHIRKAIRARYAILPYVYTTFYNSSVTGLPVIRPLWAQYPAEENLYGIDDSWLFGSDYLIKPVTSAGATSVDVVFPGQEPWYDIETFQAYQPQQTANVAAPADKIPVFQRGGSIVPRRERARRSSPLMDKDPFTLVVALDKQGTAFGNLYDDDGRSFNHRNGDFIHRTFTFDNLKFTSSNTGGNGKFKSGATVERIIVVGLSSQVSSATLQVKGAEKPVPVTVQSPSTGVYVLRKPDAPIDSEFTITLS